MKWVFFLILFLLLAGSFIFSLKETDNKSSTVDDSLKKSVNAISMGSSNKGLEPTIKILNEDLLPRNEPDVDLDSLNVDLTLFEGATNDPAVVKILTEYKPPSVGVVLNKEGKVFLETPNGNLFEAAFIGKIRSESLDGKVALEAITAEDGTLLKEMDSDKGGVTLIGSPSEIWIIDKEGKSQRVSPLKFHATSPIISPNGEYVAFIAQYTVGDRLHPEVLMIRDFVKNQLYSYGDERYGLDYAIAPIDWVDGGKVLRVIEDWGETGGHMTLKQVDLSE